MTKEEVLAGYISSLNPLITNIREAIREDYIEHLEFLLYGPDKSYSFSQLGLGHLCGIKDFRKYVPSFTYTSRAGKKSERFAREEIEKFIADVDRIDALLEISRGEKYITKFNIKLLKEESPFRKFNWEGRVVICFEDYFFFQNFVIDMGCGEGDRHYMTEGTWVCMYGDEVVIEDDEYCTSRLIGYRYSIEEFEAALESAKVSG